ncbi:hypothetical protein SEMRO_227_G092380.1 [Seminavis robusta]|uniref:Uncharacterized protein n=1 Tax=Seminavis robusta TaxID=568900 RepID=A0A9N8DRB9_9STRA|nr:hypothetical protein SEMRO_227_G092380.1 [Seminavis robusta]|eukprot:Sro227_g092380.1 n/a (225) ;mRNA; r:67075-67749
MIPSRRLPVVFFSKQSGVVTAVSHDTLAKIAGGVKHGIQRCYDRQSDVDMFVCLQGDKYIPNKLPINLEGIDATMETGSNGDLKFKTLRGNHTLNVIFSGGGSQFRLQMEDRPPQAQQHHQRASIKKNNEKPRQRSSQQQRPAFRPAVPSGPEANNRETARRRTAGSTLSLSDSSDDEPCVVHVRRRQRTGGQRNQSRQHDGNSSSPEQVYQDFSQLTGRRKCG